MTGRRLAWLLMPIAAAALALACDRGSSPTMPSDPAMTHAMPADMNLPAAARRTERPEPPRADPRGGNGQERQINVLMHDACDGPTFNAALGPGTCTRNGGVSFDLFIDQLTRVGEARGWFFAPPVANARVGQTFVAVNGGGETHTFTEVETFGGGIVPQLNTLSHNTIVAPECASLEEDDFIAPGGTYREDVSETGRLKFQCCIHPWMRLEARVSGK